MPYEHVHALDSFITPLTNQYTNTQFGARTEVSDSPNLLPCYLSLDSRSSPLTILTSSTAASVDIEGVDAGERRRFLKRLS